jgi:hypothetical protein
MVSVYVRRFTARLRWFSQASAAACGIPETILKDTASAYAGNAHKII